ncbi:hypothetical protein V8F06_000204 [Rhypophila decipiens]
MSPVMDFVPETAAEAAPSCLDDVSSPVEPNLLSAEAGGMEPETENLIELDVPEDPKTSSENQEASVGSDHETLVGESSLPDTNVEIETEEMKSIKDVRIRGGFRPIAPQKMDQDGNLLLAGHFDNKKVIHRVTVIERFLCETKTKAGVGYRFVSHEPDSLLPETKKPDEEGPKSDGLAPETGPKDEAQNEFRSPFSVKKPDGNEFHYQEYFEIKQSPKGGLGCFAIKDLKKHDLILMETPILKTDGFNLYRDFRALDEETQKIYMGLHAIEAEHLDQVERIKRANAFQIPGGIAILGIGSRFNHGCGHKRNVSYTYDPRRNVMSFEVMHDIVPAGEELLVTYGGSLTNLYQSFGFRCQCGGCRGLSDEDVRRIKAREYGHPL